MQIQIQTSTSHPPSFYCVQSDPGEKIKGREEGGCVGGVEEGGKGGWNEIGRSSSSKKEERREREKTGVGGCRWK
ncbi:hypothetical protein CEXT_26521 [Caerostris extrusa]|uniref:Uncharacterized protein n=1 Tax=Caerostris extrusa TaxID=172846 RepID=A0AAV4UEY2_CAEEX|nr:hypothetical protein CEXT_26521 [Caerostris extrusa]